VRSMEKPVNRTAIRGATFASLLASIGAAFAASCCVLPFALSVAGVSGAWVASSAALFLYRTYFLGAAAGALAIAWGVVLWRRRAMCREDAACGAPNRTWLTFGTLGLSTLLVGVAATWRWLEPVVMSGLMRIAAGTT
jgi:mercuric ion transport protein